MSVLMTLDLFALDDAPEPPALEHINEAPWVPVTVQPEQPPTVSAIPAGGALDRALVAFAMAAVSAGRLTGASNDPRAVARLVNELDRGIASDRPAPTLESVARASELLRGTAVPTASEADSVPPFTLPLLAGGMYDQYGNGWMMEFARILRAAGYGDLYETDDRSDIRKLYGVANIVLAKMVDDPRPTTREWEEAVEEVQRLLREGNGRIPRLDNVVIPIPGGTLREETQRC